MWYAFNPVLIAASFLPPGFCWINLTFYLLSATIISYALNPKAAGIASLIYDNYNLILVFILITLAVQLLSSLIQQLSQKTAELEYQKKQLQYANRSLEEARNTTNEAMDQIMSLYQVVEAFTAQDNPEEFLKTFADYAATLTKSPLAFFWTAPDKNNQSSIVVSGKIQAEEKTRFLDLINNRWDSLAKTNRAVKIRSMERDFYLALVRSNSAIYGIIGVELSHITSDTYLKQHKQQLLFLSNLSAVIMERFRLEEVSNNLLISEEQNRIANDIHDSVSQRLFSMACAIHVITTKWDTTPKEDLHKQLQLVKDCASSALHELRSAIYRLSSKKRGEEALAVSIKTYLDSLSKLNGVIIDFNISGDEDKLPMELKRALYRIICEATGNAIRHGKCNKINIELAIHRTFCNLTLQDDGNGFVAENWNAFNCPGLGLRNMKNLIEAFHGTFELKSEVDSGTNIQIDVPHGERIISNRGEVSYEYRSRG
jgi:NarL family two-component system sensor histidine kinase LiaS